MFSEHLKLLGDPNDADSVGGWVSVSPRSWGSFPTSAPPGPPQFSPAVLPGVLPGASSGFSEPATSGEPAGGWTGDEGGGERCTLLLSPKYLRPQFLPQS